MDNNSEELEELENNSNYEDINEFEPVSEPDSSNSVKTEGVVKDAVGKMSKDALKSILKSPWFWGGIAVIALFLIVFLYLHADYDLFGVGEPKPKLYPKAPPCTGVYLTYENESYTKARRKKEPDYVPISDAALITDLDEDDPEFGLRYTYKEYEYDTYISGIVWNDNKNALDVDNEIMYQAMAIAARSRLISELPNNCVVLKNYNEQAKSFTELTGSEEKYTEITGAVQLSKGIMIGRNGTVIKALYDPFSYTKKRLEEDEAKNNVYFYHMMNINEAEEQVVPAEWVDDLEKEKGSKIPKTHVDSTLKLGSMSLYGGKYLLEKVDSQYELYRILEYYYGRDLEYYTLYTDYSDGGGYPGDYECSPISMKSTSLSREEFIKRAQAYGNSKGGGAKILGDNAGMIYDMATSNGINPELVFIRAEVEGYSPGESRNNYWGLGCTNTGGINACISYRSLAEGVSGFLRFVSKFATLTDMMGKYAYLGDYWYNPGSWSIGGCVYASAIYGQNIPERVRNACAPGKTCDIGGGKDCVPTTAEDRYAYLLFQAEAMLNARKKIFGLDADICEPPEDDEGGGTGTCKIWKQSDPRWANINLGNSSKTMKGSGCAVTSVAIAISCSGVNINNIANFNPGTLVQRMNSTGGFEGPNIRWSNNAINYFAPTFKYDGKVDISGSDENKISRLRNIMGNNKSILLHFKNEEHARGHYTVLKSISGTNLSVYDPATGSINAYHARDLDQLVVYKY